MGLRSHLQVPISKSDGGTLTWEYFGGDDWLIATQDCDLDQLQDDSSDFVELRLVEAGTGQEPQGIRSRHFRLPKQRRLDGRGLRPLLPAAHIATLPLGAALPEERLLAFKLWLGRRYDRAAVPESLVPLMRGLGKSLIKGGDRRRVLQQTRDIFVAIDESSSPPRYGLTAVCEEGFDKEEVEALMVQAALDLPDTLGTLIDAVAAHAGQVAIRLLERTYVADLSDASIKGEGWLGSPPL